MGTVASPVAGSAATPGDRLATAERWLRGRFPFSSGLVDPVAVGRAYLADRPDRLVAVHAWAAALDGGCRDGDGALEDRWRNEVRDAAIASDFVVVDGWVLTRVEAEACAALLVL